MKSYLKIFITLVAFAQLSLVASAQTQIGIVKTKGRLGANGSVVSGMRLAGASVKVQGRNAVLSNNNGVFTFPVPGQRFSLVSASKTGYVLTDPDILMRQHTYSGQNPVFVVMETPETQLEDQLASERKIRRNLSQKLAAREQEIEQLKNENKITKQEYQKLMQELYANQESNEKLIKDMAKRYASMDYDQLDDLNRRVQAYILDGNLIAADSLINSKGDIVTRANSLKIEDQIIATEEKELAERTQRVVKLKKGRKLKKEDLAKDCMHKAEIHRFNLRNDSAAFYLELRADIDTLNVDWQIDAGEFFRDALADYDRAQFYMTRIEPIALKTQDKYLQYRCFMQIGHTNFVLEKLEKAENYMIKALALSKEIYGTQDLKIIPAILQLGDLCKTEGEYQRALEIYHEGYAIIQNQLANSIPQNRDTYFMCAKLFSAMSAILESMGIYREALQLSVAAEGILSNYYEADSPAMTDCYMALGNLYSDLNDNTNAITYLQKAYNIDLKHLGENHPSVALDRNNLAAVMAKTGDFQQAIKYATQAITTFSSRFGYNHPYTGEMYHTLGFIYFNKGEYDEAIQNYSKVVKIFTYNFGSQHPRLVAFYEDMAKAYEAKGELTNAKECRAKAEIAKDSFVEQVKSSINEEKLVKENTHPQK